LGTFGCWVNAYNYIYQANAILAGMQGNRFTPSIAGQITGEAEFIRAFWYFYLVNEYGDVPLTTTTAYNVNAQLIRTSKALVYRQIVNDLLDAENLLNVNYVDPTDTTVANDRVRPNQSVAAALLARVYLYMGIYDSAEIQATKVIANPTYTLINPLTSQNYVFNISNNSEAIWQLGTPLPAGLSGATIDGNDYILTSAPLNVSLSTSLVNSFEPGDQRKAIWVGSYTTTTTPAVTYYFPYKYQENSRSANGNVTEYIMVLRLAEQFLIRSEAEANLGDSTDAISDLNVIRNRAGLANYDATINGPLLSAILHERRVELFTEWGHRWFDLIRTGAVGSVMGAPGNACQFKGGSWNDNSKLYPIMLSELEDDPNLTQNLGY